MGAHGHRRRLAAHYQHAVLMFLHDTGRCRKFIAARDISYVASSGQTPRVHRLIARGYQPSAHEYLGSRISTVYSQAQLGPRVVSRTFTLGSMPTPADLAFKMVCDRGETLIACHWRDASLVAVIDALSARGVANYSSENTTCNRGKEKRLPLLDFIS